MIEILSGVGQSLFGNPASYQMPDHADQDWRQNYLPLPHTPLLNSQWASTGSHNSRNQSMAGLQDVDMSMFQQDSSISAPFMDSYGGGPGGNAGGGPHHYSPPVGYNADTSWASDVDMGTPSTGPFPTSMGEVYHAHSSSNHLQLPQHPGSLHSPQLGSRNTLSPHSLGSHPNNHLHMTGSGRVEERPPLSRSNTAPEQRSGHRRSVPSTGAASAIIKRSGSDDGEDEYIPAEETRQGTGVGGAGRGRKRQRVPHTAVERRYRENLNAHLDKLRQTVPAFAKRRASGAGGKLGAGEATGSSPVINEGVKPSKCEILNGAIEHILAIDKENAKLKDELQLLRARLDETERWYGGNSIQGSGSYPGP